MRMIQSDAPSIPLTKAPSWLVIEEGYNPLREREVESLMTVGNGYLGTRGSLEEGSSFSNPGVYLAGVYDTVAAQDDTCVLVLAPSWFGFKINIDGTPLLLEAGECLYHRRTLDMKQGFLFREWRHQDPLGRITRVQTWRFTSLADPHLQGQRVVVTTENYQGTVQLQFELNSRYCPERQEPYLEVLRKEALQNGNGLLLLTRTSQSAITLAMASESQWKPTISHVSAGIQKPIRHIDLQAQQNNHGSLNQGPLLDIWSWEATPGDCKAFDRLVTLYTTRDSEPTAYFTKLSLCYPPEKLTDIVKTVEEHLAYAWKQGMEKVLANHIHAWGRRWFYADIQLEGDLESERALHFAMYHLIIAAAPWNERVSIGARSLSGSIYEGHIFWDTEIFILPFFIYTWPEEARSLLMYRYHTLPAARRNARENVQNGAHFAWESTITGEEMTPPFVRLPDGQIVMIYSGEMEDHIVADIAYAVWHYWLATGDTDFMARFGSEIILECARFWASRVIGPDAAGFYHIHRIIGPDEYHENVNDNTFTNYMARWNLQIGAETAQWLEANAPEQWQYLKEAIHFSGEEIHHWQDLTEKIYVNYQAMTRLFEQFTGFFQLNVVDVSESLRARVPPDVLWGRKVVQGAQVIKQADVLMLFFLFRNQFTPEELTANFNYYEPITAHGSSLSPSIHALLAARMGAMDKAMHYFRETANIDLANHMGNASGGVHAAAMGGLWQVAIHGFAGVQLTEGQLNVTPLLPTEWKSIAFRVCWHGQWVWFRVMGNHAEKPVGSPARVEVKVEGNQAVPVAIALHPPTRLEPGRFYVAECNETGQWSNWREAIPLQNSTTQKAGRL